MATSVVVSTTEALTLVHNFIRTQRKITTEAAGIEQVKLTVDDTDAEYLRLLVEKAQHAYERERQRHRRRAA